MADKKAEPAPPTLETLDTSPPEVEVIKTTKTEDGLRWHTEDAGDKVRVYVTTPSGRQLNRLFTSEKVGRETLREFLRRENEIE